MAYGHAERNLATLRLLQRQADLLLEKRKQQQGPPAPQQADATGSRSGRERDPGEPRPAAPHRAGHGA